MTINKLLLVGQFAFLLVIFSVPLFGAAGTFDWVPGWIFLVLFFGFTVSLTAWLYANNPGLLKERMTTSQPDQKTWDKVFFATVFVLFVAWLTLMPLDAVRFRWSVVPVWLQIVGGVCLMASFGVFFVTFRENSFLSPMVRIQKERGQTVISSGPYRFVRHPMYAGFLLFMIGTALLLGSWLGLLAGGVLAIAVARRAVLEERMLRDELDGYDAYTTRVRYRLVPGVW
jgi:protein-S-isoprenylcysteine O-methyltransferase Ste14